MTFRSDWHFWYCHKMPFYLEGKIAHWYAVLLEFHKWWTFDLQCIINSHNVWKHQKCLLMVKCFSIFKGHWASVSTNQLLFLCSSLGRKSIANQPVNQLHIKNSIAGLFVQNKTKRDHCDCKEETIPLTKSDVWLNWDHDMRLPPSI